MSTLFRFWYTVAFALLIGVGSARSLAAGELAEPTGPVILEVSGAITNTNAPGMARFDLAMLESLDKREFETTTPWTEGVTKFEGVRGKSFAEAVGATGAVALAAALNEYRIEIPLEDFTSDKLIIAYRMDDAVMSVRDKGPLWIIFDFDSDDSVNTDTYQGRSIWQLRSIRFRD